MIGQNEFEYRRTCRWLVERRSVSIFKFEFELQQRNNFRVFGIGWRIQLHWLSQWAVYTWSWLWSLQVTLTFFNTLYFLGNNKTLITVYQLKLKLNSTLSIFYNPLMLRKWKLSRTPSVPNLLSVIGDPIFPIRENETRL